MKGARLVLCFLGATVAAGVLAAFADAGLRQALSEAALATGATLRKSLFEQFLLNPFFHLVIASVLALELLIPVDKDRPLLTKGLLVDALWLPVTILFALGTPFYVIAGQHLFLRYLGFLQIDAVQDWPFPARFAIALLAGDLVNYADHVVRHKVPGLWYFHAIHHAQRELNVFTENRVHPLDLFFHHLLSFIPMMMIEPSPTSLVAILWLRHWHARFCHANVRTNLGVLRYVLVTPQSHRVHHSLDPDHRDRNFGVTFSLWDHLFGTQHRDYAVYPECGIDDHDFPFEQGGRGPLAALAAIAAQLAYPFAKLAQRS